jgi:hypothetical protein
LLVEGQGLRMFFAGDSLSPAGIDDYCAPNRNWLGRGVGFDRCIALLEKLQPTHIFNPHVRDAFQFTPEQYRFIRANLAEREPLFGRLFPWDHPNYGMDEPWIHCRPYEQRAKAGRQVQLRVVATNHSTAAREFKCRLVYPRLWSDSQAGQGRTDWGVVNIPAKTDGEVIITFQIPARVQPGRYVLPVDVQYGAWTLPQFTEAIVVL